MGNKRKKSVFETRRFKESMKFVYGFGGAIVIIGAMFKITHWPGATEMLVAGLTTEALIFIISSFEPLHDDPDWSKVYPELASAENEDDDDDDDDERVAMPIKSKPATAHQLDQMLAGANIDSALLTRLGDGMKAIAGQADTIAGMSNISQSAQKFSENLDRASQSIDQITHSSEQVTQTLKKATMIDFSTLHQNIQTLEENIEEVNKVYDGQVKGLNAGIEISNQTQNSVSDALSSLKLVAENATLYQENIEKLAENISRINEVYEKVLAQIESELPEERRGIFERLFGFFGKK